jgi:TM2 domain-containing membrane protein YozV
VKCGPVIDAFPQLFAERREVIMFCRTCGKEIDETTDVCPHCGIESLEGSKFCNGCGAETKPEAEFCVKCGQRLAKAGGEEVPVEPAPAPVAAAGPIPEKPLPETGRGEVSEKSRLAATLLALFLGWLGIHRFYLGKTGTAVVMLVLGVLGLATVWFGIGLVFLIAVGIWALVDFVLAVAGAMKDRDGKPVKDW